MADYEDDNVSDEFPGVSLHFIVRFTFVYKKPTTTALFSRSNFKFVLMFSILHEEKRRTALIQKSALVCETGAYLTKPPEFSSNLAIFYLLPLVLYGIYIC